MHPRPRNLHLPSDGLAPWCRRPWPDAIGRGSGLWTGPWPGPWGQGLLLGRRTGSSTGRPRTLVRFQRGLAQCPDVGRSRLWLPGESLGTGRYRSGTARNTNRMNSLNWSVRRDPGYICLTNNRLYRLFPVHHVSKRYSWNQTSWREFRLYQLSSFREGDAFFNANALNLLPLLFLPHAIRKTVSSALHSYYEHNQQAVYHWYVFVKSNPVISSKKTQYELALFTIKSGIEGERVGFTLHQVLLLLWLGL